jgi:hypothetical protein
LETFGNIWKQFETIWDNLRRNVGASFWDARDDCEQNLVLFGGWTGVKKVKGWSSGEVCCRPVGRQMLRTWDIRQVVPVISWLRIDCKTY